MKISTSASFVVASLALSSSGLAMPMPESASPNLPAMDSPKAQSTARMAKSLDSREDLSSSVHRRTLPRRGLQFRDAGTSDEESLSNSIAQLSVLLAREDANDAPGEKEKGITASSQEFPSNVAPPNSPFALGQPAFVGNPPPTAWVPGAVTGEVTGNQGAVGFVPIIGQIPAQAGNPSMVASSTPAGIVYSEAGQMLPVGAANGVVGSLSNNPVGSQINGIAGDAPTELEQSLPLSLQSEPTTEDASEGDDSDTPNSPSSTDGLPSSSPTSSPNPSVGSDDDTALPTSDDDEPTGSSSPTPTGADSTDPTASTASGYDEADVDDSVPENIEAPVPVPTSNLPQPPQPPVSTPSHPGPNPSALPTPPVPAAVPKPNGAPALPVNGTAPAGVSAPSAPVNPPSDLPVRDTQDPGSSVPDGSDASGNSGTPPSPSTDSPSDPSQTYTSNSGDGPTSSIDNPSPTPSAFKAAKRKMSRFFRL